MAAEHTRGSEGSQAERNKWVGMGNLFRLRYCSRSCPELIEPTRFHVHVAVYRPNLEPFRNRFVPRTCR
jgi:hypothetical protein